MGIFCQLLRLKGWNRFDAILSMVTQDRTGTPMGTKELKETFNSITGASAACTVARLTYERPEGKEVTILTFEGTTADGMPFSIRSEPIPPKGVVELAVRETAQRFLEMK